MRRASTCLALLGLAVLGLPAAASAAPVVTFKAKAVPIPGFPHTGNILGAGAAVQVECTIKGNEYGGFAAPLIGVNVFEPAGTKLHPQGFTTCSPTALENTGPSACPTKSKFTIAGEAERRRLPSATNESKRKRRCRDSSHPAAACSSTRRAPRRSRLNSSPPSHIVYGTSPSIDTTGAARRNGARGPRRLGRDDQREGRLGLQEGQNDRLLRHRAEEVPERRLPAEVGTDLRGSRRSLAGNRRRPHYKAPCPRK